MTNYSNNLNNVLLDFDTLPIESLPLEQGQIEQAIKVSNNIVNEQKQWDTYINALALFAFESWLDLRAPELQINSNKCSIWQPSYANVIDGVFNLEVGQFKLFLLAVGNMTDEFVTIPRAVVDLPEYAAHFYVLVNVQEEQEEATVESFVSYSQLQSQIESVNLRPQSDWTYDFSGSWFDREPDNLLLYLKCLEEKAIALPQLTTDRVAKRKNIQIELESLIPQLQLGKTPLWEILDWDTAIVLLTDSQLLGWLYQIQTGKTSVTQKVTNITRQLAETGQNLTNKAINVGSWLQNEMDEFTQSLAWNLLPAPTFALGSLRSATLTNKESPAEELEAIIAQLRNSAIAIPVETRGAYQDFDLGTNPLRLYALAWTVEEQGDIQEWSLLMVLGSQPDHQLPENLRLQIKEQNTVLDEKVVQPDSGDSYLYSRVIGTWDEEFSVTVILANGEKLVLPSFSFAP